MWFEDLSEYSYSLASGLRGVRNVGWLGCGHDFPRGDVPGRVLDVLTSLAVGGVRQMRGVHLCELCDGLEKRVATPYGRILLGTAEIWIPDPDQLVVYAAPDMIIHYIADHSYRPPDVFVRAAERVNLQHWDAEQEVDRLLRSARRD